MFSFERKRAWVGERQRAKETQNPKQASGSQLLVQSLAWGLNLLTVKSWLELKSDVWLSHPGAPIARFFLKHWVRCQGGETKHLAKEWLKAATFRPLIKGSKNEFHKCKMMN